MNYHLRLFEVLDFKEEILLNDFLGEHIEIRFTGGIHCVVSGEKITKVYGEGMSYKSFMESPQASESIIHPELSQAHLGIGLRDLDWEIEHHVKPHTVYLARTSGAKVGVTRSVQKYHRWMDQGATEALVFAETPYRQAAGLIEVALKSKVADKTNFRELITNTVSDARDLRNLAKELRDFVPSDLREFLIETDEIQNINYPVIQYPQKANPLKLDKVQDIKAKLLGIRGQYLLFDGNRALNIRAHSGYEVQLKLP